MADRLLVSPEQLRDTAAAYRKAQADQAAAYQTIRDSVEGLQASWEGKASESFIQAFRQLYKNLEQSELRMLDAAEELMSSADFFEQTEEGMSTSFAGLDSGTNPFLQG